MRGKIKTALVIVMLLGFVALSCQAFAQHKNPWMSADMNMNYTKKVSWQNTAWWVNLKNGRLSILVPRTENTILIDTGVNHFLATGTGVGLMGTYKNGNELCYFHRDSDGKIKKAPFFKGIVKSVALSGEKTGMHAKVTTPDDTIIKYWIDDRGSFLKETAVKK